MIGVPPLVPGASKAAWRGWAKEAWKEIDADSLSPAVVGHLAAWPELRAASVVLLYLPMAGELDVSGLSDGLIPGSLVVTRTPPDGPLTIHPSDVRMEVHRYGFLQPVADAAQVEPAEVAVALIPGLCFDRYGGRLGRGRGYFDELLGRLRPEALRVGVVPSRMVTWRLPSDLHDVPMTHLATEFGVGPID